MVLAVVMYRRMTRGVVLALPASVVVLPGSPWGGGVREEVSPRGWWEWFALAFHLALATRSALAMMIAEVVLEGGTFELPSSGLLDMLAELNEVLHLPV